MADAWGSAAGGLAASNPWSAGIMAAGSVATAALSSPPMNASQTTGAETFDNSGWAVNIGTGAQNASSSPSTATGQALPNNTILLLAALAALYLLTKR